MTVTHLEKQMTRKDLFKQEQHTGGLGADCGPQTSFVWLKWHLTIRRFYMKYRLQLFLGESKDLAHWTQAQRHLMRVAWLLPQDGVRASFISEPV